MGNESLCVFLGSGLWTLRPTEEGTGELVRNTSPASMGVAALSKVVILAVGTRLTALTDDLRPGFSPWGDLDCPRPPATAEEESSQRSSKLL
jgi:hypothetical protein